MEQFLTVVVGYDGSPAAARAVRFAAEEAARRGSVLRILTVRESRNTDTDVHGETAVGIARGYLDSHRIAAVEHVGWPAVQLLIEADRADLLVVGRRKPYRLGQVAGSVAREVVTSAHCPVVVLSGADRAAGDPDAARSGVVAGIKRPEAAENILATAFAEAELRGCGLEVMHAWREAGERPIRNILIPIYQSPARYAEELASHLGDVVRVVADKFPEVPVSISVPQSLAGTALARASRTAALLVVGAPRGPIHGALLGSAGHALMHDGACPVMFVPRWAAGRANVLTTSQNHVS